MFIEVRNLNKIYNNNSTSFHALKDINLSIEYSKLTALVGASGSGKTTLLNMIGALDNPSSGSIFIDGEDLTKKNSKELSAFRRHYLGFIFQSYNLIPVLTAYENVALSLFDTPEKDKRDIVMEMLNSVGLEGKHNNKPNQLSGGQQQRVSIARALVKKPKLLLADEPTANLDSKTGETILELIAQLYEKEKINVLFSTHDQRVMKIVQQTFMLKDGEITEEK